MTRGQGWLRDTLGQKIRSRRCAEGLTQAELARRTGLGVASIRNLEQGLVRRPNRESIQRVANVLEIDLSRLIADSDFNKLDLTSATRPWIGICGPLMVGHDNIGPRSLPPGERVVLGLLALASGFPVAHDSMIEALWPGKVPDSANAIVQTYISRLRSRLGVSRGGESLISHDGAGYRLQLTEDQLDLLAFRKMIDRARDETDVSVSCEIYEKAMNIWRGDPLEDIDAVRSHPTVTALANERINITLEFAAHADALGRHEMVLPYLQTLAISNLLDERLHAALMTALAGSGRQAESLRIYEDLRRRLDDELGMPPSDALRTVHQRVLRQEISQGKPRLTRFNVQQLPAAPADFTGRQAEIAALMDAAAPPESQPGIPIVLVSGQPGVGKTALALYAAHELSSRFPDGQLWVQLAGSSERPRDPGDVLGAMLRVLGIPGPAIPEELSERSVTLRSALAGRKVLLVIDDATSADQVAPLLPGSLGCAVVVTARVQLQDLAGARHVLLDVLSQREGIDLLTRLIGADRVGAERTAASALCEACEGLPLAIRIVGGKLATRPSWPLNTMAQKLMRSRNRLGEMEAGGLSVRASIASSYMTLSARHQLAFRRLALLGPNDFASWVVPVLLGEEEADYVLDDLVGRSLVGTVGVDATGEPRYRLHDLLRDFAAEQLAMDADSSTDAAVHRLLQAWLQLAQLADNCLPPEPYFPPVPQEQQTELVPENLARQLTANPIAWFTGERTNLQAAIEQACESNKTDLAWLIASHHGSYHHLQDRHDDAEYMWRTIETYEDDSIAGVWSQLRVAASLNERGRATDAYPILDRCVKLAKQTGEQEILAFVLYWRGVSAADLGNFEDSRNDGEHALMTAREAGSRMGELQGLRLLAGVRALTSDSLGALAAGEHALAVAMELGADSYELGALHQLIIACTHAGKLDRARSLSLREIELSRKLGDIRGEAIAHALLGDIYRGLGEYDLACESFEKALPTFRSHHASRFAGVCLLKLGYSCETMGRYHDAISRLEESREIFRQLRLQHRIEMAQEAIDRCWIALSGTE